MICRGAKNIHSELCHFKLVDMTKTFSTSSWNQIWFPKINQMDMYFFFYIIKNKYIDLLDWKPSKRMNMPVANRNENKYLNRLKSPLIVSP